MTSLRRSALLLALAVPCGAAAAQRSDPRARAIIQAAIEVELAADASDHSQWTYTDHDQEAGRDAVYEVVETPQGSVKRLVQLNGKLVAGPDRQRETDRIQAFTRDPSAQAKKRRSSQSDDAQARAMMAMLPNAYIWSVNAENPTLVTLNFRPDPGFHPPDIQAHVMSLMAGELTIVRSINRVISLRGSLTEDVKFGFGLLGKLYKGGTFDIERREVAPGNWQITESRVHLSGRALLFKTIGQQEDEIKVGMHPSTAATLEAAARELASK